MNTVFYTYTRNAITIVLLTTNFDFYAKRVFNTIISIYAVWPSMSFIFQCIFKIIENNAFCWKVGVSTTEIVFPWKMLSLKIMQNIQFSGDSESTLRLFIYFLRIKATNGLSFKVKCKQKRIRASYNHAAWFEQIP